MDNLKNFRRTNYCGDLRLGDTGKTVSLCGWVQRQRDLGGLIFVDLRDRTGLVQLSFDDGTDQAVFEKASSLRSEYVIAATGTVRERESKTDKIATGAIEVYVTELRLLAKAETPPFEIVEHSKANDRLRLKYRYLDLRRPVQSEMLGLSVKQKNELGTLLSESAAPEKILSAAVTDPSTGLHSLLSTKSYTDVIELLASDQLARVVALAREQYDYVIIDSPPLGFFSDSELLSDLSDASVLVVRQDTVPAPEINDAIDALRAGKAEFLGCILNDMSHLTAYSAGYGYGYGYYGYGYGKKYDKYGYGHHSGRKQQ